MKYKLLLLALLFSLKTFSQDSKVSLELSYPLPVGESFIGKNYKGIIDIGAKYTFSESKLLNIGVSLNANMLNYNYLVFFDYPSEIKSTTYNVQPRIFGQINIESIEKLKQTIGLGYTFMFFKVNEESAFGQNILDDNMTNSGLNFNAGIAYDITPKFFIQSQYDFIKLLSNNAPKTKYNTNISILKFGLGFHL